MNVDEVFISYHGGDGEKSALPIARRLKCFLENHAGRKFGCFLCADRRASGFYQEIDRGLKVARHFVLVARRAELLSSWVAAEVAQFDAMVKSGVKGPRSVLTACIEKPLEVKELVGFNSVFSQVDVAEGAEGFDKIYNQLLAAEGQCFSPSKAYGRFLSPGMFSKRTLTKVWGYAGLFMRDKNALRSRLRDEISTFEAFAAEGLLEKGGFGSSDLLILNSLKPSLLAGYLVRNKAAPCDVVCVSPENRDACGIVGGREIVYGWDEISKSPIGGTVQKADRLDVLTVVRTGAGTDIDIPVHQMPTYGHMTMLCATDHGTVFSTLDELTCSEISTYLYDVLKWYITHDGCHENDNLVREIDDSIIDESGDCDIDDFDWLRYSDLAEARKCEFLLADERELWRFYLSLKSEGNAALGHVSRMRGRYVDVAKLFVAYYEDKRSETLRAALERLLENAEEERKSGSISRYECLVMIISELSLHNVFATGDKDRFSPLSLYERLRELFDFECNPRVRRHLKTLTCSFEKELLFVGQYRPLGLNAKAAEEKVLLDFSETIAEVRSDSGLHGDAHSLYELFLLLRERSVIWEHHADSVLDPAERKEYYEKWRDDCLQAVETGNEFACDKELLGCVYLNLGSSLNRLSRYEKGDRLPMLRKCLEYLDLARKNLALNPAAERYLGYYYLHRADCYEAMLPDDPFGMKSPEVARVAAEISKEAKRASVKFRSTFDVLAQGWALRLGVKGMLVEASACDTPLDFGKALSVLPEVFGLCQKSRFLSGTVCAIRDFTSYVEVLRKTGDVARFRNELNNVFTCEMEALASIISLTNVSDDDVLKVQDVFASMVEKLRV